MKKRYGKPETYKQRLRRCKIQVSRKNPGIRSPEAVCRASIRPYRGKKRRVLRGRERG